MKRTLIALALVTLVAGCNKPTTDGPAVTTAPSEAEKPVKFESTPLVVDAASVVEQDPKLIADAAWTTKQCVLTVPGDAAEMQGATSGPTRLTGFFIAPDDQPAGEFDIVLKGESTNYRIPAKTGWDRTDVADFFKLPQLASTGFDANVDLSMVPAGKYKVDFVLDRAGAKHFCESGKHLVLAGSTSPAGEVAAPAADPSPDTVREGAPADPTPAADTAG